MIAERGGLGGGGGPVLLRFGEAAWEDEGLGSRWV